LPQTLRFAFLPPEQLAPSIKPSPLIQWGNKIKNEDSKKQVHSPYCTECVKEKANVTKLNVSVQGDQNRTRIVRIEQISTDFDFLLFFCAKITKVHNFSKNTAKTLKIRVIRSFAYSVATFTLKT